MTPMIRIACAASLITASLFASACAVRSVYVKPDFERTDKLEVKRLAVGATPIPGQPEKAAELLARMALRHINMHKDYLATEEAVLAVTDYEHEFASAVGRDNYVATQFHPEKSQKVGAKILENFINL